MSVPMFHYVQQQMEKYYDMIKVEKKKYTAWVRRLHLALRAYKELLNTLLAMDRSTDPTVKESAKVLKSNIFYVLEYREFILSTFLNYDENKMPRFVPKLLFFCHVKAARMTLLAFILVVTILIATEGKIARWWPTLC